MPSKRSHGEGTLRHRSDGRWELRMMDGYQKDGSPRFKTFYGKTQKEVKLKLKEYQDALISGVQLDTILYFEYRSHDTGKLQILPENAQRGILSSPLDRHTPHRH